MAIKTINKISTTDEGTSSPVDCPVCNRSTAMRLFSTEDKSPVAKISADDKSLAFAVCPYCATVFSLNKNYLKEKNAGTYVTITKEDLTVTVKGKQ